MYGTTYHPDPRIAAAIDRTHETHPYYWSAIDRLRIVADPKVPTMATSKDWVTHYNPEQVARWTVRETAAVLVHELEHLLRKHHERCGDRDPARFNIAGDAEINARLADLPEGAVYPESLGMPRGRTAEVYYGTMPEPQPKPEPQQGDGSGEGEGEGQGGASQPGEGEPQPGQCGSAAGGPVQEHEQGDAANPGRGADPAEAKAARQEAAESILASGAGTEPGSDLREWAEQELGIDRAAWYAALSTAVGHTMAPHGAPTRWQWPGRRDPRDMGGAMVPRWTGTRPSCAVVIDTSSSVTPFDLEMAAAAGHYIARVADTRFYACDTTSYDLGANLPDRLPGGGGTDLRNGIAMAIRDGAKAVVVITDCMTPWPTEQTIVPLIVGANPAATRFVDPTHPQHRPQNRFNPPAWAITLPVQQQGDAR